MSIAEALQLFGLPDECQAPLPSVDAIRRAFRSQALQWHPDKHAPSNSLAASSRRSSCGESDEGPPRTQPPPSASPLYGAASDPAPSTTSAPCAARTPRSCTQAQAAEHFKRLASAYQVLLQAAAAAAQEAGRGGTSGGGGGDGGGGGGGGLHEPTGNGWHGQATARDAECPGFTEEQLLDELSVDLLLLDAHKLRLSDFDVMFLQQRAHGSTAGVSSVFPEAAQSMDDVWRRIRRYVERRRKRRQGNTAGTDGWGCVSGRPTAGSKWALLSEFLADVVGVKGPGEEQEEEPPAQPSPGRTPAGASAVSVSGGGCESSGEQLEQGKAASALDVDPAAEPWLRRRRGRLPAGFYWRWFKRLAAARLLFFVFFKT